MKFTKMHGCGNDYVYVNCFKEQVADPSQLAIQVSDRHFGIGSDGLILICPSEQADFRMRMFNADGSEGKMCGNGVRCIAKYVYDYGLTDKTTISIETKGGIKYLELHVEDGKVQTVKVDMGEPILNAKEIPVDWKAEKMIGEKVTIDGRVNTEFVQILNKKEVNMRVWERGSGETLACGTGACATAVACILNGKTEEEVVIHLLGGDLKIQYDKKTNHVFMTGPATTVFDGEIAVV